MRTIVNEKIISIQKYEKQDVIQTRSQLFLMENIQKISPTNK